MLPHPPIFSYIILKNASLSHEIYVQQYVVDVDFKDIYEKLTHVSQVDNYHFQGKLLYHLGKLCIPTNERINVIIEACNSLMSGHLGVGKTFESFV